jgi:hypothetical protein
MSKNAIKPQNLPEMLVWYYILGTFVIYYLGAQFVIAPLLGAFLTIYLFVKLLQQNENTPVSEWIEVPFISWLWLVAILIIEFALIMGHLHFGLGMDQIVKSSMNRWFKTWCLFPMFILAGSLPIRPQLVYRAACILCFQSLFFILIGLGGVIAGIDGTEVGYNSPLKVLGGGDFYEVKILGYTSTYLGENRMQLFAPWAPALSMIANIYFWFAWCEKDKKWRWLGLIGATTMIISSFSRAGTVYLPLVPIIIWLAINITRPWVQVTIASVSFFVGIFGSTILTFIETFRAGVDSYRSGSSKIRSTIQRMTLEQFSRSPIWGHGTIDGRGPAVTSRLPLGTHHTWNSALYTHGIVGCAAFAIAMIWSIIELLIKAPHSELARVGLSTLLILTLFSFSENLDSLSYIFWPGLLVVGIAFKEEPISVREEYEKYRQTARNY